mmetsp:Transcript_52281/g.97878  ORF Transcript_52281/g.97878 Transcript_52281/m.97878 type:complete len:264 (-) Transcript_52281:20-811(-)
MAQMLQQLSDTSGTGTSPKLLRRRWSVGRSSFVLSVLALALSFSSCHSAAFARMHVFPTKLRDLRQRIQDPELSRSEYAQTLESLKDAFEREIVKWGRRGKWQKSLDFLTEMEDMTFEPGVPAYAAAIRALSERIKKQWPRALEVLSTMKDRQLSPDSETLYWTMTSCAKDRQWRLSLDLFRQMQSSGVQVKKASYLSALNSACHGAFWEEAISLIEDMENDALDPQAVGYNKAMDACLNAMEDDWFDIMEDKAAERGYEIFL